MSLRWDRCVVQSGKVFSDFLEAFLDQSKRSCLIIGGAGFDPRATVIPAMFSKCKTAKVSGLFFREERPTPQRQLHEYADAHAKVISQLLPVSRFEVIEIFADGRTVSGGRRAVEALRSQNLDSITDVFVDVSALSCGVFFSLIRACLVLGEQRSGPWMNIHLLTVEEPKFDNQIHAIPGDTVSWLHGYRTGQSLDAGPEKAVLWLPTLAPKSVSVLDNIYRTISRSHLPIDVCPIVPFPGHDPRLPDKLAEEFREVLIQWKTDTRSFLHAAESDPLDSYRTICAICSARERTFKDLNGSTVILSPVGNKLLAVGAMMAAIDRDLPVSLVEAVGYDEDLGGLLKQSCDRLSVTHVWLAGEAYFT
jgi:hypothetical protein